MAIETKARLRALNLLASGGRSEVFELECPAHSIPEQCLRPFCRYAILEDDSGHVYPQVPYPVGLMRGQICQGIPPSL